MYMKAEIKVDLRG